MPNRRVATFWKIEELIQSMQMAGVPIVLFWDIGGGSDPVHISSGIGDSLILVCKEDRSTFESWRKTITPVDKITLFEGRVEFAP